MKIVLTFWTLLFAINFFFQRKEFIEKVNDISKFLNAQIASGLALFFYFLFAPYIFITDILPGFFIFLKTKILLFIVKRKVNKVLRAKGLKERL